jgi:ATP-dependent Clp protease ATP-binding subunit ClpC
MDRERVIERCDIEQIITTMTGIPTERISHDDVSRLRGLKSYLQSRVIGQREAISKIVHALQRAQAGLRDPARPIGVFLLVGPTGVGKTLLAKELSKFLFDGDRGLIRIDMTEYAERHNIARLIGSPPGYVGYGEGGQLTEAVRRKPYSVLLLDEIEKAHPTIFNTLLQLFDEGRLTDGGGRTVDFRNTIIVMTSNVGSREVGMRNPLGYMVHDEGSKRAEYRRAAEKSFSPEFLNRIDEILLFANLSERDADQIVRGEVASLRKRLKKLGYRLSVSSAVYREVVRLGFSRVYGARSLRRVVVEKIEEPIAHALLSLAAPVGKIFRAELQGGKIVIKGGSQCQKAG